MALHASNTPQPSVCEACRGRKRRCDLKRPVCTYCKNRGRTCVYPKSTADLTEDSASSADVLASKGASTRALLPIREPKKRGRPIKNIVAQDEISNDGEHNDVLMSSAEEEVTELIEAIPQKTLTTTPQAAHWQNPEGETFSRDEADADAMLALRGRIQSSDHHRLPDPRHVQLDDIDLSLLPPVLKAQWIAITQKVFDAINFVDQGEVVWDLTGNNLRELRQLIREIRNLQAQAPVPTLVEGLERLALVVLHFHDFFEQLRICMMSRGALEEALAKQKAM